MKRSESCGKLLDWKVKFTPPLVSFQTLTIRRTTKNTLPNFTKIVSGNRLSHQSFVSNTSKCTKKTELHIIELREEKDRKVRFPVTRMCVWQESNSLEANKFNLYRILQ